MSECFKHGMESREWYEMKLEKLSVIDDQRESEHKKMGIMIISASVLLSHSTTKC